MTTIEFTYSLIRDTFTHEPSGREFTGELMRNIDPDILVRIMNDEGIGIDLWLVEEMIRISQSVKDNHKP